MYNVVQEKITGTDMDSIRTDYYYRVSAHEYEDALTWYNGQHDIVESFLSKQPEAQLNRVFRRLPAHPREPSDDLMGHPSGSSQYNGKPYRKDVFRKGELVSRTDYTYEKKSTISSVFVDMPIRLISVDHDTYRDYRSIIESMYPKLFVFSNLGGNGDAQTEFFLDTENHYVLSGEKVTEYRSRPDGGRDSVVTSKKYGYDIRFGYPERSIEPTSVETAGDDGARVTDEYGYLTGYPAILARHKRSEGGDTIESRVLFREGTPLPERVQSRTDRSGEYRDEVVYSLYDGNNNVAQIQGKDGTPVTFIWSYYDRFPVAKIENATREEVIEGLGYPAGSDILDTWSGLASPSDDLLTRIAGLRDSLAGAKVTVYRYDPDRGLTGIIDPNGVSSYFERDAYGRLTESGYTDPDLVRVLLGRYDYNFGER